MINYNEYLDDLIELGITDKEEQVEVINSLLRFTIIAQNNYNKINAENEEEKRNCSL